VGGGVGGGVAGSGAGGPAWGSRGSLTRNPPPRSTLLKKSSAWPTVIRGNANLAFHSRVACTSRPQSSPISVVSRSAPWWGYVGESSVGEEVRLPGGGMWVKVAWVKK
jgi:hypothetical protein